ncbi:MAG: hypothetical protein ACI9VR_002707, partial [Cognaticolwellia sp.]
RRLVMRLERRRRFQDLLLLLLRALAALALILAAARPELSVPGDAPEFGGEGAVVFVLDDSLSMAQTSKGRTLMARARADALEVLEGLAPGTRVGVVRIGGQAQSMSPELIVEHGRAARYIDATDAGYGGTDLAGGLLRARELLAGESGEVLVFTDQAGPGVVSGAEEEIAALVERGSSVIPRIVQATPPKNVAVLSASYGDGLEGGSVRVEIANYGPDAIEVPVTLALPDGSEITAFTELPAEGKASERFTVPSAVPGGVATVTVDDPDLALDDRFAFHLPRVGASRVLVVDGDPGRTPFESEVYFLERALAPWGGLSGGLLPETVSPSGMRRLSESEHRVVFLANVEDPGAFAPVLTGFVQQGGGLVISVGKNVTGERYNDSLKSLLPAPLRRATSPLDLEGVRLGGPDLSEELFEPFAGGGYAGFTEMNAFRYFTLEPFQENDQVKVLLSWQDGSPALVERKVGLGRVLLWTSSFDYDDNWSHSAVQAVFMPFIQRLVRSLGGDSAGVELRAEGYIGQRVELKLPNVGSEPRILGPDGQEVPAQLVRGQMLALSFVPSEPGAYQVGSPGQPPAAWVAVNVAPQESDVRVSDTITEVQRAIDPALLERKIPLGPVSLWVGLVALLAQAILSFGLGGRDAEA